MCIMTRRTERPGDRGMLGGAVRNLQPVLAVALELCPRLTCPRQDDTVPYQALHQRYSTQIAIRVRHR